MSVVGLRVSRERLFLPCLLPSCLAGVSGGGEREREESSFSNPLLQRNMLPQVAVLYIGEDKHTHTHTLHSVHTYIK